MAATGTERTSSGGRLRVDPINACLTTDRDASQLQRARVAVAESTELVAEDDHLSDAANQKLARVVHDLRNPLAAIHGVATIALQDALEDLEKERFQVIKDACDGMLELVGQLLETHAHHPPTEPHAGETTFDLEEVIHEACRESAIAASQKGLDLFYYRPKRIPRTVALDRLGIKQVLSNLISNAVKFTEDGSICVRVNVVRIQSEEQLHVVVEDTGVGIAREMHASVFQSYRQVDSSDDRGVGLGLSICKQIIESMGGQIWVESRKGVGSRFHFTIPDFQADASESAGLSLAGHRALVVTAKTQMSQALRYVLSDAGAGTTLCTPDAFAELMTSPRSQPPEFDSIIVNADDTTDELLPLLEEYQHAPTHVVWLCPSDRSRKALESEPVDNVMTKPILYDKLLQTLSSPKPARPSNDAQRILVVEDSEVNQMIAAGMLGVEGHQVDVVSNGRSAVESMRQQDYDLVLMDIEMPDMNGYSAAMAIREHEATKRLCRTPIVAMTGHDTTNLDTRARQAGIDACLGKPLDPEELWKVVDRIGRSAVRAADAKGAEASHPEGPQRPTFQRARTAQLQPLSQRR